MILPCCLTTMNRYQTRQICISLQVGLNIHIKALRINTNKREAITLQGSVIEEVEVIYLGSIIARIGKVRTVFLQLKNIWNTKIITTRIKVRLSNTNVKSLVLYGSKMWRTIKETRRL